MTASGRIIGLYQENAAAWDRERGRDLHEAPWLERFAGLMPVGASVLDIGCGMGEPIGCWLAAHGYRVTGVDAAPSLIAMARERLPDQQWLLADMRAIELGRRFGGLIAWHSFFHLPPDDQKAMFARFAAHAAPGAALLFTSGPERGEAIGAWQSEPLYHASLGPEEYRALLQASGFAVVDHRPRDPDCRQATVWLAVRS